MFIRLRFPLRFRWLIALPLFEIARVLVRLDHVARFVVNPDHCPVKCREFLSPIHFLAENPRAPSAKTMFLQQSAASHATVNRDGH
jgi:hypothetical protein